MGIELSPTEILLKNPLLLDPKFVARWHRTGGPHLSDAQAGKIVALCGVMWDNIFLIPLSEQY